MYLMQNIKIESKTIMWVAKDGGLTDIISKAQPYEEKLARRAESPTLKPWCRKFVLANAGLVAVRADLERRLPLKNEDAYKYVRSIKKVGGQYV